MPPLNVLISGGGIAGPCFAWWLSRATPCTITIIERAPEPRTSGQAVDIREAAVSIIQRMSLEEEIRSKHTTEEGISFIYADGKGSADFGATGDTSNQGFTSEYEILRGDLARVFYEATKKDVRYVFDEFVEAVEELESEKVRVRFGNHLEPAEFDLVVGADGQASKIRRVVFGKGPEETGYWHRMGQYMAFFTMEKIPSDTKWACWYGAPGGHLVFTRPDPYGERRAFLGVTDSDLSRFDEIEKAMEQGHDAQMKWLEKEFQGVGWQTERVLQGMRRAKDFYMQEVVQVKMEEFVKGHVALLGDAGFAPSPISGMGTAAAIVASYVLAGEISKSPTDVTSALLRYQSTLRPFVDQVQRLPPGAPQIANPQTELGLWVLNSATGICSSSFVKKMVSAIPSITAFLPDKSWSPPVYEALENV